MRLRHLVFAGAVLTAGCDEPAFPSESELNTLRQLVGSRSQRSSPGNRYLTSGPSGAPAAGLEALGSRLFSDVRFSSCGRVSCSTCHPPPTFALPVAQPE